MRKRILAGLAVVMAGVLVIGTSMALWLDVISFGGDGGEERAPRERDAVPVSTHSPNASRLHEGVVLIETEGAGEGGFGTGMVISSDGLVVTNYHVVEYGLNSEVEIALTGETFEADVLGFDRSVDIALLQLEGASGLSTVEFSEELEMGDTVTVVGNANGQGFLSDEVGDVIGLDTSIWVSEDPFDESLRMEGLIQVNAIVASGCSGGPVFGPDGTVVGVTVAGGSSEKFPEGYAIPAADAQSIVDTILAGQDSGSTRVGPTGSLAALFTDSSGVNVTATMTDLSTGGAQIVNMQQPSPLRDAGLDLGDVIRTFDGERITSAYDLYIMLKEYEPGQVVQVVYDDEAGTKTEVTVTLAESRQF